MHYQLKMTEFEHGRCEAEQAEQAERWSLLQVRLTSLFQVKDGDIALQMWQTDSVGRSNTDSYS